MHRIRCDVTASVQQISTRILQNRCYVSRTKNLYEVLGLQRNATQVDIKNAYYKLSMIYHPDKNKESDSAAEKFRELTEAYEVLGNFRLRKLYDKGIIHTAGEKYKTQAPTPEEDEKDPTTRFYKARMRKEHPTATGRTPIYDFDEWTRSHYATKFKHQKRVRENAADVQFRKESDTNSKKLEVLLGTLFAFGMMYFFMKEQTRDINRLQNKKSSGEEGKAT